jgi:hypothetical protein
MTTKRQLQTKFDAIEQATRTLRMRMAFGHLSPSSAIKSALDEATAKLETLVDETEAGNGGS